MAKTKISEFDIDPANNTDINSINIAEGCAPSGINNAIRQLMSDLKEFQTGAGGDPFNGAVNGTVGATTPNTGAFTTLSASGAFSANGGATLGDASGDALTINSSAVSIPNGLTFDGNVLSIDATNNRVGILNTNPSMALDVREGSIVAGTGGMVLYGRQSASVPSAAFGTGFFALGVNYTDNATGGLTIYTRASDTLTERMRITSAGNVGIGTSSPSTLLGVKGDGNATGSGWNEIANFRNAAQSKGLNIGYNPSANNATLVSQSGGTASGFEFWGYTGSAWAERMRLDSSGNLGLGVTPSAWQSTRKAAQVGVSSLSTINNNTFVGTNFYSDGTSKYIGTGVSLLYGQESSGIHAWYNAPSGTAGNAITFTQAMTLDASGNLGIGTSSPLSRATIATTSGNTALTFQQTDGLTRNWLVGSQYTANQAFEITPSTANGGSTFSTPAFLIAGGTSNIGIGTTSPSNILDISRSQNGATEVWLQNTNVGGSTFANYRLINSVSSGGAGVALFGGGYSSGGMARQGGMYIYTQGSNTGGMTLVTEGAQPIYFGTNNTERMRIDTSGNLLVGKTSLNVTGNGFTVEPTANGSGIPGSWLTGNSTSDSHGAYHVYSSSSGSYKFYATYAGVVHATSTSITAISDQRLKENIRDLDLGVSDLLKLQPRRFDWKEGKGQDKKDAVGFIAQEFETVLPNSVTTSLAGEDGIEYKAISYEELVPVLVKAIQELKAEVDSLKAQLNK